MWDDPIVEEVRKAGKLLSEKCDNDINKFAQMIKKGTEQSKKEGWKIANRTLEKVEAEPSSQ